MAGVYAVSCMSKDFCPVSGAVKNYCVSSHSRTSPKTIFR